VRLAGGKGKPHTHTLLREVKSFIKRVFSEAFSEIFRTVSTFFPQYNVDKALSFVKSREVK
jgi:hypothetical protein